MKRTHSGAEKFSVDRVMQNVAKSLIRDFQESLNDITFCSSHYEALNRGEIGDIRSTIDGESVKSDTVAEFKALYQMKSLFKRHRFEKDLYSDSDLVKLSIDNFISTQNRIADHTLTDISAYSTSVLDRAAVYISKVLGEYNDEEHRSLCRFGRRASVGVTARLACEAERWEIPISGSQNQIDWFDSEMASDPFVQEYWDKQKGSDRSRSTYQSIDFLKLTLVPKSYKSLRAIMPNTTIGSYMSYGLGEMIRKRLKKEGYDISKLQMQHRKLAQRASIHNGFATVDLSSASDSISVALVERLFPPDWFRILNLSRIGNVLLPDDTLIESKTFCTMGIGYTFPLQTLVFLSILHALRSIEFGSTRMTISVYGDDMIYNVKLHPFVLRVFGEVGFVINDDKSFIDGPFRESCGGDYFRGVDVRPFQPRNDQATVNRKVYEAVLYKCINGLLMRWDEYEIGETLKYLLSELNRVVTRSKLVPAEFPDDSGIKCSNPAVLPDFLKGRTDVVRPVHIGHGVFRFSYLRIKSKLRKETRHEPYYWRTLRGPENNPVGYDWKPRPGPSHTVLLIEKTVGVREFEPLLIWEEARPIMTTRSELTGRRLRRLCSFVTYGHSGTYTRQSGTSCFGVPRT